MTAVVTIMNPVWGNDELESNHANATVTSGDEANGVKPSVAFSFMVADDLALALESVNFTNNDDSPAIVDRTIELNVTNANETWGGATATETLTVSVTPENDGPSLGITAATNTYTEDGQKTKILTGATITITDPDDIGMTKLLVKVKNFCDPDSDVLEIDENSAVYSKFNATWQVPTNCTLKVVPTFTNGTALISDWKNLMQDIQFYSTNSSVVVEQDRHFRFELYDAFSQGEGSLGIDDRINSTHVAGDDRVVLQVANDNDAPVIVVPDGSDTRATTDLIISENTADGMNLLNGSSIFELLVYDVDSGLGDFTITLSADNTDDPTTDILMSASLNKSSEYPVYNGSGVQLTTGHWGADRIEFVTKTTVASVTDSTAERSLLQYFDYENIDPATNTVGWKNSYDADTRTFALRVTAADAEGATTSEVLYFKLSDVAEAPQATTPSTGSNTDREGISTSVYGMASQRKEYRHAVNETYLVKTPTVVTSFIQVDEVTHDLRYNASQNTSDPAYIPRSVTYKKLDMIHGEFSRVKLDMTRVFVDPEGDNVTYTLSWKGYQNKSDSSEAEFTAVNAPVNATGTNVLFDTNATLLFIGNETANSTINATNGMFDTTNPLKWECVGTICYLSGTPNYDAYVASLFKVDAEVGTRTSPEPKTLQFILTATDDSTSTLTTSIEFRVDIEIAGCMDVRASYVPCADGTFDADDCTNFLTQGASGTNMGTFLTGGFDPADKDTYTSALAPANQYGLFNEEATVPSPTCAMAPRRIPTGSGSQQVGGSSVAATSADAVSIITDGSGDLLIGTALTEALDSLRGTTFLDVDTDLLDSAATFSLEQIDASEDVIIPEGYDGITSAAVKVGPAGLVVGTNADGVPGFKTTVYPGAFDTAAYFCAPLHATLKDSTRPELGYKTPEPCEQIEVAQGGACVCFHSSNSIIIPALRPLPQADFLPSRYYQSGGGCPSECSGHGFCRAHGKCACFAGWGGYDCASRECPFAEAWAADDTISRRPTECSGRGSCDRSAGTCDCFDGFEGPACERLSCPAGCSGHGKCRYINELPDVASYSEWDAERIQACVCDGGYFGADCSMRTCPRGDDPQTLCDAGQNHEQTITIELPRNSDSANDLHVEDGSGAIALRFTGADGTVCRLPRIDDVVPCTAIGCTAYDAAAVKTRIENAFKALPSFAVDAITVTPPAAFDPQSDTSFAIEVEFTGTNTPGDQALLQCDMSCPLAGCRPKHSQLRLSDRSNLVAVEPSTDLEITAPSGVGVVGVQFTVTFTANSNLASGYSFVAQSQGIDSTGTAVGTATTLLTAPVPMNGKEIEVANGFRFSIDSTAIASASSETVDYYPVGCSVAVTQRAGQSFESAECSNRGLCDRSSGLCECFEGYAGSACSDEIVSV